MPGNLKRAQTTVVDEAIILETGNADPFVPGLPYDPATKQYVDNILAGISSSISYVGAKISLGTLPPGGIIDSGDGWVDLTDPANPILKIYDGATWQAVSGIINLVDADIPASIARDTEVAAELAKAVPKADQVTVSTGVAENGKSPQLNGAGLLDSSFISLTDTDIPPTFTRDTELAAEVLKMVAKLDLVVAGGTAAASGKVPKLDAGGRIDTTMLPIDALTRTTDLPLLATLAAFINASTGLADADKPIKTDAAGLIDDTFMPTTVTTDVELAAAVALLAPLTAFINAYTSVADADKPIKTDAAGKIDQTLLYAGVSQATTSAGWVVQTDATNHIKHEFIDVDLDAVTAPSGAGGVTTTADADKLIRLTANGTIDNRFLSFNSLDYQGAANFKVGTAMAGDILDGNGTSGQVWIAAVTAGPLFFDPTSGAITTPATPDTDPVPPLLRVNTGDILIKNDALNVSSVAADIMPIEHLLPRDGTRGMTADLPMGNNNILAANTVNAQDIVSPAGHINTLTGGKNPLGAITGVIEEYIIDCGDY